MSHFEERERPGGDSRGADAATDPNPLGWFFYALVRPSTYVRYFAVPAGTFMTVVVAWMFGMTHAMGRLDGRPADQWPSVALSWPGYCAFGAVAGVLSGALYFLLGGWWYKVRLQWSGARTADPRLARRVYLYTAQVFVLPYLVAKVLSTGRYEMPLDSAASGAMYWWEWLVPVFLFWSVWTSYFGVCAAFDVTRGRALVWFGILPTLLYCVALGAVLASAYLTITGALSAPPDLRHPQAYQSEVLVFDYPGNWWVGDEQIGPDGGEVFIEPMQDAGVAVLWYASDRPVDVELGKSVRGLGMDEQVEVQSFGRWGALLGAGAEIGGVYDGVEWSARIFVSRIGPKRRLEIRELWRDSTAEDVTPGFRLIEKSLRLR